MKSCLIVGHGPSLTGAKLGKQIDSHENIIRLKTCSRLLADPDDYGQRTHYLCSSTEAAIPMLSLPVAPIEYWLYPKKGSWSEHVVKAFQGRSYHIALGETMLWNMKFRALAKWDGGVKNRNVSTGMAAILIAAQRLQPEKIWLAGFDTTLDPGVPYESTYNPGTQHKHMHDFSVEHRMLDMIREGYNVEINNFLDA